MKEKAPPVSFRKIWNTITGNDQLLWIALIFLVQQVGNNLVVGGIGSTYIYLAFGYRAACIPCSPSWAWRLRPS